MLGVKYEMGDGNEMGRDTSCWWAGSGGQLLVVIRVRGGPPARSHGSTRGHRSSDTACCCPLRGAQNHKTKKTLIQFLTLVSWSRIVSLIGLGDTCVNDFSAGYVRPWWAAAPVPPVPAVAQQPPTKHRSPPAPESAADTSQPVPGGGVKTTGEEDHESLLPPRRPA